VSHTRPYRSHSCASACIHHHVVCRHQIEIEVWPAAAEVYFQDERYADPVNTQVRFEAAVYNAPTDRVLWTVSDVTGGPGAGTVDPTGLYLAPPKGPWPHGHTDIVVATAMDDPMRRASARVVLVGRGPEPKPLPKLEVYPKYVYLYYRNKHHNAYIDRSNKQQQFRTVIRDAENEALEWWVTGAGTIDSKGLYTAPDSSDNNSAIDTVHVRLQSDHTVTDEARVRLINYDWPGIAAIQAHE
jgi:hypothetical protein